jgi:hypothetical protein
MKMPLVFDEKNMKCVMLREILDKIGSRRMKQILTQYGIKVS